MTEPRSDTEPCACARKPLDKQSTEIKPHGGRRLGAGRPQGAQNKTTAEVRELAAAWGPAAILKAAELAGLIRNETGEVVGQAQSEQARIAALGIILDRAYGKAAQTIVGDPDQPIEAHHRVDRIEWVVVSPTPLEPR